MYAHGPSKIDHPSVTALFRINMLGPPNTTWDGSPFTITRRQARALLYRLAFRLEPVPREQLCFLFWSDIPESTARRNLSRLLSHVRRALPTSEIMETSGDYVILNREFVWSDTVVFERLSNTSAGEHRPAALQEAADLYRGPFLHGFSLPNSPEFEAWASTEARIFERHYLEALEALIVRFTLDGAYDIAVTTAQRYLATDELAEQVHRRLIQLYAALGDRPAALRQFENCAAVLEEELGVSPLPETRAAYQAVLDGQRPLDVPPVVESRWTTLPSLDVPFVGHRDAQRCLERAYSQIQYGAGGVVLISGENGVGKSRLMQDFANRHWPQALVLAGAAQPSAQSLPYQPLTQVLRSAPLSRISISPVWLAEASRLLPELRTLHPHLPPPMPSESDEARVRLFEALCQITLSLTTGSQPVILCLDDIHWADSTTLDWLVYLGQKIRNCPLLVLGTYRSEEAETVRELRHNLIRLGILTELELSGLDTNAVAQLLRHLIDFELENHTLVQRLWQATGGNPFFLLETLRTLIETGQLLDHPADLADFPLPDTVREAVRARLARLSPVTRQILEAGAVLGASFDLELIHRTAGRGEMETLDGLDELLTRQLLLEQADAYRFQHEIIPAVVYRDLSLWRRRLLHRRAGETLKDLRPDDAAALAWHFEQAEEPGQAAAYALQTGLAAKAVFAHREARAYFDRALALLEKEASHLRDPEAIVANQRLWVQALYERGWALRLLGDMEAYAHDLDVVARLAKLLGDQRTLAHLRWREAYTHRWFCRYTQAREAAEEGTRLSRAACDEMLEAMCWREVGRAARATGDYDQAQTALEQALHLFEKLGEAVHEIHTLGNLSTLFWYQGKYERAMDLAHQAATRCDDAGLPLERRLPLGDIGAAAGAMGDVDFSQQCLLKSLSISRNIADRTQEILCLGHLGWLCVKKKQTDEALEHLQAALNLAQSIDSCTEQSWLLSGLAQAHRLAGNRDQALAHAHRALELAQAIERTYDVQLARKVLTGLKRSDL